MLLKLCCTGTWKDEANQEPEELVEIKIMANETGWDVDTQSNKFSENLRWQLCKVSYEKIRAPLKSVPQ